MAVARLGRRPRCRYNSVTSGETIASATVNSVGNSAMRSWWLNETG
ncbi:MAG: hypothetical protein H6954_01725 [Chromatiaceae bacterium]|nr:hypothetical protein [Chromatiaceae bacterium]